MRIFAKKESYFTPETKTRFEQDFTDLYRNLSNWAADNPNRLSQDHVIGAALVQAIYKFVRPGDEPLRPDDPKIDDYIESGFRLAKPIVERMELRDGGKRVKIRGLRFPHNVYESFTLLSRNFSTPPLGPLPLEECWRLTIDPCMIDSLKGARLVDKENFLQALIFNAIRRSLSPRQGAGRGIR
jgi:hypothetical protein